jgi:glycogen operon protein
MFTPLLFALMTGCATEDYTSVYAVADRAPSLPADGIEALEHMGPTIVDGGINFAVYSENAERLELLIFEDPESELPTQRIEMTRMGDVWNRFVEGVGVGTHYGYIAWGPNWTFDPEWLPGSIAGFQSDVDANGNRFNPNKLLTDPWAKAMHRDHDWSRASVASGPQRTESTYGAGSKSVAVRSDYEWSEHEQQWREGRSNDTLPGHQWRDLVMYEVHPKGFTQNPASGVDHPGTFRGIGEMAPYLADLGINALELMPVHEKPLDGGYWGYNNLSFFALEHSFSASAASTGRVDGVLDEFKWMVDQLHQNGIEVIVDVVYNHTGEGGLWRERLFFETYDEAVSVNFDPKEVAGLYNFRGLDNAAWYALSPDGQTYWNNTGVGNQLRPNHTPGRRLILDSMHFMIEELHVDGFRFDLAGILGEKDGDYNAPTPVADTILQDIADDPVVRAHNVRLIAEPWTASGTGPGIGGFTMSSEDPSFGWAEWNAHFRDWWRAFVNHCNWSDDGQMLCHGDNDIGGSIFVLNSTEGIDGGAAMTGSESVYGDEGRAPVHSVNFVTVHDGFTLYDLFSYDDKQNECGLLNPKCCDDPFSVWCDTESGEEHNRSHNWGSEAIKRQQMRNLFTAMMISQGTPLLLGGDEWMRTQFGNNNAYSTWADNEWNWFRWGEWRNATAPHRYRMHDFVRQLIRFRAERIDRLNPGEYGASEVGWKTAMNTEMTGENWSSQRHMMVHHYGESESPELVTLLNFENEAVEFTLPESRQWVRVIDTQAWYDTPADASESSGFLTEDPSRDPYQSWNIGPANPEAVTGSYTAQPFTIVVLEAQ